MSFLSKLKKARSGKIPPCTAVIVAAGRSKRMGGEDKLFIEIHGVPVLAYSLNAFQYCGYVNEIIIVTREDCLENVSQICKGFGIDKASKVIIGGNTRLLSVMNGVFAAHDKAKLIAIHDGARPCIESVVIDRAIESAAKNHAVAPAIPVSSTIKRANGNIVVDTIDRSDLFEIQTPQVFDAGLIKAALTNAVKKSIEITDDCMAVELIGAPVHITEGSRNNIKLTTGEDINIAAAILMGIRNRE